MRKRKSASFKNQDINKYIEREVNRALSHKMRSSSFDVNSSILKLSKRHAQNNFNNIAKSAFQHITPDYLSNNIFGQSAQQTLSKFFNHLWK